MALLCILALPVVGSLRALQSDEAKAHQAGCG
jgi:hypothetical protein